MESNPAQTISNTIYEKNSGIKGSIHVGEDMAGFKDTDAGPMTFFAGVRFGTTTYQIAMTNPYYEIKGYHFNKHYPEGVFRDNAGVATLEENKGISLLQMNYIDSTQLVGGLQNLTHNIIRDKKTGTPPALIRSEKKENPSFALSINFNAIESDNFRIGANVTIGNGQFSGGLFANVNSSLSTGELLGSGMMELNVELGRFDQYNNPETNNSFGLHSNISFRTDFKVPGTNYGLGLSQGFDNNSINTDLNSEYWTAYLDFYKEN